VRSCQLQEAHTARTCGSAGAARSPHCMYQTHTTPSTHMGLGVVAVALEGLAAERTAEAGSTWMWLVAELCASILASRTTSCCVDSRPMGEPVHSLYTNLFQKSLKAIRRPVPSSSRMRTCASYCLPSRMLSTACATFVTTRHE